MGTLRRDLAALPRGRHSISVSKALGVAAVLAVAALPAVGAAGASAAEIDWGFRQSFRSYVSGGDGKPPISASAGASCAPNPNAAKGGCDPQLGTPAPVDALRWTVAGADYALPAGDGTITGTGTVVFSYPAHTFKITLQDPTFRIQGSTVTVEARVVQESTVGDPTTDQRVQFGEFPLAGPVQASDATVTWRTGPGVLTRAVLGSSLPAGSALDPVTIVVDRAAAAAAGAPPPPAALPPPAPAARAAGAKKPAALGGHATLTLQGAALRALRARGVRFSGAGGAKGDARRLLLPVSHGTVAGWASLQHPGSITLRTGRRSVRLSSFKTALRTRSVLISALVGKHRVTILSARPARGAVSAKPAAGSIALKATPVSLTAAGARAIRAALALRSLAGGKLGVLAITAAPGGAATTPSRLVRPASAVDLATADVTWNVRPSFIRYVATGEGTSVSGGATADPPVATAETDVPLSYTFHFPFASGWSDAGSGRASVRGAGAVTFSYKAHGIKIAAADPEIVLDGKRSLVTFALSGTAGAKLTGKRSVLVDLDPAKAASKTVSPDGRTTTYADIPGTIPGGTENSVFAGFYIPGEQFGSFTIALTTR